jgi:NNP family nitrate/nitrite transporter-like MFS transporter
LGVFGAGNVGAAGTKLLVLFVPSVLTLVPAEGWLGGWFPGGWRAVPVLYSAGLIVMAALIVCLAPVRDPRPAASRRLREIVAPLRDVRVWRFGLYYVVVFGAYVALSGWLPKFYIDTWETSLYEAALYTASFIFPASLLRPLGGWLSDRYGPRVVTYAVFIGMIAMLLLLAIPNGDYLGLAYWPTAPAFASLMLVVGCCMGIGKASVFKYIPNYFPGDVGAVGGMVGMLGALGGFLIPPVLGSLGRATGIPQMAFIALLLLTGGCLAWLHVTVLRLRRTAVGKLAAPEPNPLGSATNQANA